MESVISSTILESPQNSEVFRFEEVYERFQENFSARYFIKYARTFDDAEDISQEFWIKVSNGLSEYHGEGLKTWLYKIAKNTGLNYWRTLGQEKRKATTISLDTSEFNDDDSAAPITQIASNELSVVETLINEEIRASIYQLLERLPPSQMLKCLRMRVLGGKKYREIAADTGLSLDTVKAHLYQGRQKIMRIFALEEQYQKYTPVKKESKTHKKQNLPQKTFAELPELEDIPLGSGQSKELKQNTNKPEEFLDLIPLILKRFYVNEEVRKKCNYMISVKYGIPMPDAEDIFQEVFSITLRKLRQGREIIEDLEGWIIQVTKFQCIIYWRTKNRNRISYQGDMISLDRFSKLSDADNELAEVLRIMNEESHEKLKFGIEGMRHPGHKKIATMKYLLNYTPEEIAQALSEEYHPASIRKILNRDINPYLVQCVLVGPETQKNWNPGEYIFEDGKFRFKRKEKKGFTIQEIIN